MNEEMKRLIAMRDEQDRTLAELEEQLRALGNAGIVVPQSYLDEMEALCAPRPLVRARGQNIIGLRG